MQNEKRQNAVYSVLEANKEKELVLRDVYFVESDQNALLNLLNKIQKNSSVTSLVIDSISVTNNTISLIISSFKQRLKSIKISELEFKDAGAGSIIAKKLTILSNLYSLDLSGCKIGEDGSKALNGLLDESKSLQELRLDSCGIDDKQIQTLLSSVIVRLKVLSLKRNAISPQSAEALKIPTLEELNLSSNKLGIDGVRILLCYFATSSLLTLDIRLNFINNTTAKIVYSEEFGSLVMKFIEANKSRHVTFYDLTEGANSDIANLQIRIAQQKGIIPGNVTLLGSINLMQEYEGNQK